MFLGAPAWRLVVKHARNPVELAWEHKEPTQEPRVVEWHKAPMDALRQPRLTVLTNTLDYHIPKLLDPGERRRVCLDKIASQYGEIGGKCGCIFPPNPVRPLIEMTHHKFERISRDDVR
jgi:hypothetical protein